MVNLLRLFQGGGMGGATVLPSDAMDQPQIMMTAFAVMADFDARLREEGGQLLDESDGISVELQQSAEERAMASWLRGGA